MINTDFDPDKLARALARTRLYDYYPETGQLSWHNYPKHMEFFRATKDHMEVAFVAGNRTGKSFAMCYAGACHLVGWYPEWWPGRRFAQPITCWASGVDAKAVRESLQPHLLGPEGAQGTGLVPGDHIKYVATRPGIAGAIDFVMVERIGGGVSKLVFKAYEQGRESYQGAQIQVALMDEEPPLPVYTEQLTRLMATDPKAENGILMAAFTPLMGISEVVLRFLPGGKMPATEAERLKAWGW